LNAGAFLQLVDSGGIGHTTRTILRLTDLLCHTTKIPNPNCKPVSGFQNLLKNFCSLHQKFSHKKSKQRCWQPKRRPLA